MRLEGVMYVEDSEQCPAPLCTVCVIAVIV